ncbi:hypothetical protein QL285_007336 [Trifolium repens]|nr:hypothetical protein QL285_007336 [Trifolium repens]
MIALTILCLASAISQKESSPVCLVQRCLHQTYFTKESSQCIWSREVIIKHIPGSRFCKQPIHKFTFNFPKKIISSVSGQDNTFSYCVLLSYIDSRQYLHFMSCSPTLTADNVFISCLALPH